MTSDETWDEEPAQLERLEDAKPVALAVPISNNGTADPESYVIGCCLLDEGATLDKAIQSGLASQDFATPDHGLIYRALRTMRDNQEPIDLGGLHKRLPNIAITRLMDLADPLTIGTTARASHYINRLLQASANRRAVSTARALLERAERGEDIGELKPAKAPAPQRKPSDFLIAADDDASVLLGNRFLNRGDGGILVGSSGMGKSSASIQMAVSWALGLPFMGIKSNGALRILIIQSEDSDGDIAEVMLSMRHMLNLTDTQIEQIDSNIRIISDRINRGAEFISALKAHINSFAPDLIIINPLQAFIDGDVTESRDLGQFLREGLNGLNDSKFGYLLVHHTTKPSTGKDRNDRQWHEVMYDMAGGAELINWARFVMSLRAAPTPGDFNLVLAKRGRRAGVTQMIPQGTGFREEIITTIPLRHATGSITVPNRRKPVAIIFWEPREADEPAKNTDKSSGRPEKYRFNDYRNIFPGKNTQGLPLAELHRCLIPNGEIKKNILHSVCERWSDDVEIIDIPGKPRRYRATL